MVKPRTWVRNNATHFQDDFGWKSSPNPAPPVSLLVWFSESRDPLTVIESPESCKANSSTSASPSRMLMQVSGQPVSRGWMMFPWMSRRMNGGESKSKEGKGSTGHKSKASKKSKEESCQKGAKHRWKSMCWAS